MNAVRRCVPAALVLAVGSTLAMGAPAAARTWFVRDITSEAVRSQELVPGSSITRTIEIHNRFHGNAQLYVRAAGLTDEENGCIEPETEQGDTTCHADQGELSRWLKISISTVQTDGNPVELWSGDLTELTQDDVLLLHRLPEDSTNLLQLVTTMDPAADSSTMTDRVDYDLGWTMTQGLGNKVDVLGMESRTDPPGSSKRFTMASAVQSLREAELQAVLLLGFAALILPLRLVRSRRHR